MALTADVVQNAYLAYFGRPADPVGLNYWMAQSDAAVMKAGFAASVEYATLYAGMTTVQQVSQVYTNMLGRAADVDGLLYWAGEITAGRETVSTLVDSMQANVLGIDIATVANRLTYATAFTAALDTTAEIVGYSGTAAADAARTAVTAVVDTAASLTTATTALATSVATVVGAGTSSTGTTFTLTTGVDQGTAFTGGAGNDTFVATSAGTADAANTLNAADVIVGGTGTDTLNLTVSATDTNALGSASISGIETINVRSATAGQTATVDASAAVGATAVNAYLGAGAVTVTSLAAGASLGVVGNGVVTNGTTTFSYASATTAETINISGGVLGGNITQGGAEAATTATVNSTGAANVVGTVDLVNTATLTSVTFNAATNLEGDFLSQATDQVGTNGAVTISGAATSVKFTAALDNTLKTIDASGLTAGGLTATLGTLNTQVVTGGAGNDVITTSGTVLTTGSVNAGAGTDTLVLGTNVTDANTTTLAAKFTNFETLRVNGTFDASLIAGITAIELSGATNAITKLNATQAAAVKARADIGATTLTLTDSAGTSDVLSLTLGTGTTTAAAANTGILTITGFETLNLATNHGPTATVGANRTTTVTGAIVDTSLTAINLTGSAFTFTDIATTKAVTINGSALVGDGATTAVGLTVGGLAKAGSTITGSAVKDVFTIGAEGSTYDGGAGNDTFTTTAAILTADGTTDLVLTGGTGTDTLAITGALTLTDNQFTNVTGMEKLDMTAATTTVSVTALGAAAKAAFATGMTVTSGTLADNATYEFAGGLYDKAVTLTLVSSGDGVTTGTADTISITTGAGADTISVTAASWVGQAGAANAATITTNAGDDTIYFEIGDLLATTAGALTINAGTGADTIEVVHVNDTTATALINFTIADGDSLAASRDMITGFLKADGTNRSDVLDFGTANVAANTAGADGTDSGTILSHAIASGIITFDDVNTFATAIVVNEANLANVLAYVAANISTAGDTVAFEYDSDSSGTADATIVFNQGTLDSVVELVGVTGATSIGAFAVTNLLIAIG